MDLLTSYRKQFAYYRHLGQAAMAQVTFEQLLQDTSTSNSIAVIVKHLVGNMRSRWTDFLTTDGEKPWRDREDEFIADFPHRAALKQAWNEGWGLVESALHGLTSEQLNTVIYIRNEGHTVYEALNRQLAHYSYHVGQIVLLAKQLRGAEWQSLSIPRGESAAYNARKFTQQKERRHFTDEWMNESRE